MKFSYFETPQSFVCEVNLLTWQRLANQEFKMHLQILLFDLCFHQRCVGLCNKVLLLNGHSYPSFWYQTVLVFFLYLVQFCHGPLAFNVQEVLYVRLWSGPSVYQHHWWSPASKYIWSHFFPLLQLLSCGKLWGFVSFVVVLLGHYIWLHFLQGEMQQVASTELRI